MLFLVKTEISQVPNTDRDTFLEMVRDQWKYILDQKNDGRFLEAYRMAGRKGGIALVKARSHGELNQLLSRMPLYPWLETEIIPLVSMEEPQSRSPTE